MAPVIFRFIPYGNFPLDFGKTWRGHRILGDNKTFRGIAVGILTGCMTAFVQSAIIKYDFFQSISLINYGAANFFSLSIIGGLMGLGALAGDSVKSFFKRRRGIIDGASWIGFDQIDFTVGALVAAGWIFPLTISHILIILIVTPLLHVIANIVGYLLGLNKKPL